MKAQNSLYHITEPMKTNCDAIHFLIYILLATIGFAMYPSYKCLTEIDDSSQMFAETIACQLLFLSSSLASALLVVGSRPCGPPRSLSIKP